MFLTNIPITSHNRIILITSHHIIIPTPSYSYDVRWISCDWISAPAAAGKFYDISTTNIPITPFIIYLFSLFFSFLFFSFLFFSLDVDCAPRADDIYSRTR
jgi:hypothetical protein